MIILRNDSDYQVFARQCLAEQRGDTNEAFQHYIDECSAAYDKADDGPREAHIERMTALFNDEARKLAHAR